VSIKTKPTVHFEMKFWPETVNPVY